jgi:aminodeoxyfutalosine synthase
MESFLHHKNKALQAIAEKTYHRQRISEEEALLLYTEADTAWLGVLANHAKQQASQKLVFFNRNFHLEPTNICLYQCKFCSYKRKMGEDGSWEYTYDDIAKIVEAYKNTSVTEIHIVGGVHPQRDLHYYGNMIKLIKSIMPAIHVKAFTAIELDFMIKQAKMSLPEGFRALKEYGLDSIPGGGAEIFDAEVRKILCPEKSTGEKWLEIHHEAHLAGVPSNATILYGHIEKWEHRIDHMSRIRQLQDETKGFNAFIPLKYRKENNHLSHLGEVSVVEDIRNYAISRLFLDNIPHIKAYWPMIGRDTTKISLSFGVDDIDGTIDDSTKIYTMAGFKEKNTMTMDEMLNMIKSAGYTPAERDSVYNVIQTFEN